MLNAKTPMMLDNFALACIDLHVRTSATRSRRDMLPARRCHDRRVMEIWTRRADGRGGDDHSALVGFYEKIAGETIA
ncbi:MAG: hypothetical protein ACLVL7_09745 [Anaerotruncus massiliensis (ex Togo et al. 2019)]